MTLRKRRSTPGTYFTVATQIVNQMQMERNGGIHVHSIQPCLSASLSLHYSIFFIITTTTPTPNPIIHQLISTINHLLSSSFLLHQIKTQKTNPSLFPFSSFSPLLNQLPPPVNPPPSYYNNNNNTITNRFLFFFTLCIIS